MPTVPMASFIAIAIVRDGGLCTAPSNLSAHAAYEKMRSMLAATSFAACFSPTLVASRRPISS